MYDQEGGTVLKHIASLVLDNLDEITCELRAACFSLLVGLT